MTLLWTVLSLGVLATTVPSPVVPPDMDPEARQVLAETAARFAGYWADGRVEEVSALLASSGVVLHLAERPGGMPLPRRRAVAALRDFLRGFRTMEVEVNRVVETGGIPPKGFAEIRWVAVPAGTSQPVAAAVFVGFEQEEAGWRVSELRLLR